MKTEENNLLGVFDRVQVDHSAKITTEDREFCERVQAGFELVYDRLKCLYQAALKSAEQLSDRYTIERQPNGTIKTRSLHYSQDDSDFYSYESVFFDTVNQIINARTKIVRSFNNRILNYFKKKYNINLPLDYDETNPVLGPRPYYIEVVDKVITSLGGKSFRAKAEIEILVALREFAVDPSRDIKPVLKANILSVYNVYNMDKAYGNNRILSDRTNRFEKFRTAIAFLSDGKLNGGSSILPYFREDNIDLNHWYMVDTERVTEMKFFKNGRIDVRFNTPNAAAECYHKIMNQR